MIINKIALILSIIGSLNWGLVGLFSFDLVAWICGGATTIFARIIYALIIITKLTIGINIYHHAILVI